jgi:hypothetical protein
MDINFDFHAYHFDVVCCCLLTLVHQVVEHAECVTHAEFDAVFILAIGSNWCSLITRSEDA